MGYIFGEYSFDVKPYSLARSGIDCELTPQQAQLLELLIENAGDMVSRQQIRERLWAADVHVDFDRGINFCVARLRSVLGDSTSSPRFVETVPRRGYRFVALVTEGSPEAVAVPPANEPEETSSEGPVGSGSVHGAPQAVIESAPKKRRLRWSMPAPIAVALLAITWWAWSMRPSGGLGDASAPSASTVRGIGISDPCGPEALTIDLEEEALAALQRACWYEEQTGWERQNEAIPNFEVALLHHPDFVPVLARLALHYRARGDYTRAEPLAERAIRSAPAHPVALHVLADIAFRRDFDWRRAERLFRSALEVAPKDRVLSIGYAELLAAMGRSDEAIALVRGVAARDPLSLSVAVELMRALHLGGFHDEAIAVGQRVVATDSKQFEAHRIMLHCYLARGERVTALAVGNQALDAWGWGPAKTPSLEAFWELALEHRRYGPSLDQAQLADRAALTMAIGRVDEARALMERACEERSGWTLIYYNVDRRFAELRKIPGLESLDRCLTGDFDLGSSRPVMWANR